MHDEEASWLAVPLQSQDRLFGVLELVRLPASPFTADDVYKVTRAAGWMVADLEREAADEADGARMLLEAAEIVYSSLDSSSLEATILAEAGRLVGARDGALLILKGDVLVAKEARGLSERGLASFIVPLDASVFGRAVITGAPIVLDDAAADILPCSPDVWGRACRSLLIAPLQSHRATYGAITLFHEEAGHFSSDRATLLGTFAFNAAIALDNRRLIHEKDRMAVRDGLTGVYNRGYLELAIERTAKDLRRHGGAVSVLFIDVDGMKAVNDTHGHQAGDELLVRLGRLLEQCCRETDVVARYGGDEFVVLMPRTDAEGARRVELKVAAALAQSNQAAETSIPLTASAGTHTAGAGDVAELLREADRRMYAAKRLRASGVR